MTECGISPTYSTKIIARNSVCIHDAFHEEKFERKLWFHADKLHPHREHAYVEFIEECVGVKIKYIGTMHS